MISKRFYNLLVVLLPVVYIIHNTEEWFMFNRNISSIIKIIPYRLSDIVSKEPTLISSAFGVALLAATIIPAIIAFAILNKINPLNIKVLLVAALITLINGISHISSSFVLGFFSPGFITGVLLCLPYSIAIILIIHKGYRYSLRQYLFFGIFSLSIFFAGIALLWILGALIVS